ncbi:rhodanese-like domain-containing protein [Schaalia sp. 19OD2882]|nr:rhodanese-like domain-containing protein [Schaalia sp. 19OD2882]
MKARRALTLALGAALVLGLGACASTAPAGSASGSDASESSSAPAPSAQESSSASQSSSPAASTVLLDVRTPEEFAEGHLEGATNIDVQSPDFADKIAALDKDADYTLYCRSGRRAGQAKALMEQAGFTKVSNAGGVEEASKALNLPITR